MAFDKVVDSTALDVSLLSIADAIRGKSPLKGQYAFPQDFTAAINAIALGTDTSDATATAEDILYGKSAYVNGKKVVGTHGYKLLTCEVVSDVVGTAAYAALSNDPILLEHREDENLSIVVTADNPPNAAYTFLRSFAFNKGGVLFGWAGSDNDNIKQYRVRYGATAGSKTALSTISALNAKAASELSGVYSLWITEAGELRLYPLSGNYIVRAGTYTIEVRW